MKMRWTCLKWIYNADSLKKDRDTKYNFPTIKAWAALQNLIIICSSRKTVAMPPPTLQSGITRSTDCFWLLHSSLQWLRHQGLKRQSWVTFPTRIIWQNSYYNIHLKLIVGNYLWIEQRRLQNWAKDKWAKQKLFARSWRSNCKTHHIWISKTNGDREWGE